MKLVDLTLESLPGFKGYRFALPSLCPNKLKKLFDDHECPKTDFSNCLGIHPGLNILIGANGSGKTSICRAIRELLWPERVTAFSAASIESTWSEEEKVFTISLDDGHRIVSPDGASIVDRLPEKHLAPCFTMTLDELFDGQDEEFGRRISQALLGGCDIKAAQERLTPVISAKGAIQEWKRAKTEYEDYKRRQQALQREAEELPRLEQAIQEAEAASSTATSLEKTLKAKYLQQKIFEQETLLHKFPPQLIHSKIQATDWASYEHLIRKRDSLSAEIKDLQISATATWPSDVEIEQQVDRIGRIEVLRARKERLETTTASLTVSIETHQQLLGIYHEKDIEKINASFLDVLEDQWKVLGKIEGKIILLREQIQLCSSDQKYAPEILERAMYLLTEAMPSSQSRSLLFCGIFFTGLSLLSLVVISLRLVGIGMLLPLSAFWLFFLREKYRKKKAMSAYQCLALPPITFNHLRWVVQQWGKSHQIAYQQRRKEDLENLLRIELESKERESSLLQQRAAQAGIGALPETRYRFTEELKKLHREWIQRKSAQVELEQISGRLNEELDRWNTFLTACEESPQADELPQEMRKRHNAILERARRIHLLYQKESEIHLVGSAISELLLRTDCQENPSYLCELVSRLDDYREEQSRLQNLREQCETPLPSRINEPREVLEAEKVECEKKAKALQNLSEAKGYLASRIQYAQETSQGQEVSFELQRSLELAQGAARDFAKKELLQLLIDETQKEFQRDCQPEILRRAADWFQRFTRHQFFLAPLSGGWDNAMYGAIHAPTNEYRTLSQLSRGTRVQLLIAMRLASAFESTGPCVLPPLFLDEVLANADPERFDAVAKVIAELAAAGSQIFYLTSNPEDEWKWKEIWPDTHTIRLDNLRPSRYQDVETQERFPKPHNEDISAYILKLNLPCLRTDQPLESVPVHYLVDNPTDLHRLLSAGLETYGAWRALRPELREQGFPNSFALIEKRGALLERFFALKTQGKGHALTREALREGGVTETFMERLWPLALELDRDPKRFIQTIENKQDSRSKRFSEDALERLRSYLVRQGHLDERASPTNEEIRRELLPWTKDGQDHTFLERLFAEA